jgi:hypothetical protein
MLGLQSRASKSLLGLQGLRPSPTTSHHGASNKDGTALAVRAAVVTDACRVAALAEIPGI